MEEIARRLAAALAELDVFYREHAARRPIPEARWLLGPGHHLLERTEGRVDALGVMTGNRDYAALLPECEEFPLHDVSDRKSVV